MCGAASGSFFVSSLDTKRVTREQSADSMNWWQGGVGEQEARFNKPCPSSAKQSAKPAESPGLFLRRVFERWGKSPDPHRWYRGTSPCLKTQPRVSPRGANL